MEDIVRRDLLAVINKAIYLLEKKQDPSELKQLSNHTIHNASIFQDEYSVSLAVITYSLSKIIEKRKVQLDDIIKRLKQAAAALAEERYEQYRTHLANLLNLIAKKDKKYRFYIQEVIRQASIRKGSKIYEHGVSASRTAALLGISLWEFYDYLGATQIFDRDTDISSVRERLKYARSLFQ
jgi:hypothetical protein